jgi:hypothetical protein
MKGGLEAEKGEKIMNKYIKTLPVRQHPATNYCWAAGLSWWMKAVKNQSFDYDFIKGEYDGYISYNEDDGSYGSLNGEGMYSLLNDGRWGLDYKAPVSTQEITTELIGEKLQKSPVIIGYMESSVGNDANGNRLTGFHMNVIICPVSELLVNYIVVDPNYDQFQIRNLQHYKQTPTLRCLLAWAK